MRRIIVGLAIIALSYGALVGCGGEGGKQDVQTPTTAIEIQDDHRAYYDMQEECPVCGGRPIKQEFHADTDKGRIYFDKKQCVDKFNENRDQYLKKFGQQVQNQMPGVGPSR